VGRGSYWCVGPFRQEVELWRDFGGVIDTRTGEPVGKPAELARYEFVAAACLRFHALPSQVLAEDADLSVETSDAAEVDDLAEVVDELERHTGREVATSAVFVALQRLKAKELLDDRLVEPGEEGGHARRYFRLTDGALEAMRDSRQSFLSLWRGVESALDEPGA